MNFKINNDQEWIACQKYFFNKNIGWFSGGKRFFNSISYIFPLIISSENDSLGWSTLIEVDNYIEFNKFMREEKLKRILK